MGQTLTHGVYLPDEGERNCYNGLAANWQLLDNSVGTVAEHTTQIAGKANAVHTHTKSDITDFPAYGNAAGTICEGNDSRLSDARTPVAHTHGKADITDLFNTDNTWSGTNTFTAASINIKSSNFSLGDTVPSNQVKRFQWYDASNNRYACIAINYATDKSVWVDFPLKTKNTEGTSFVDKGIRFQVKPDSTSAFLPITNLATDIGTSTNQWNNLYAKNYYYNGTAWGLDKANEWTTTQTIKANSPALTLKSNVISKGTIPSSRANAQIFFRDNSDYETARILYRADTDGTHMLWIGVNDVYSNGALDPAGSSIWNNLILSISPTGQKAISVNSDIIPDNSTYNLGTSTNQWKSVYSQTYYYNGVAWGLDKENVWSAIQIISYAGSNVAIALKHQETDIAASPTRNNWQYINFYDKNFVALGGFNYTKRTNGNSRVYLNLRTKNTNNDIVEKNVFFETNQEGTNWNLYPASNADINLGTSTNKWKTLNGINPGALSLPNYDDTTYIDISGSIVPPSGETEINKSLGNNQYTPPIDGWLSIRCDGAEYLQIYRNSYNCPGVTSCDPSGAKLVVTLPVCKNVTYTIRIKKTVTGTEYYQLYPCRGNV